MRRLALILAALVLLLPAAATARQRGGVLVKPQLQPRQIAALASSCWTTPKLLVRGVAVELAEALGFERARNDNDLQLGSPAVTVGEVVLNAETLQRFTVIAKTATWVTLKDDVDIIDRYPPEALVVVSRDVGLWQINIPASQVGSQAEKDLYVPANNVAAACALYQRRGFQPWAAYTSGTYLHDTYVQRALLGVVNMLAAGLVADAKSEGQTPLTRTPFVSVPELRLLYPTTKGL